MEVATATKTNIGKDVEEIEYRRGVLLLSGGMDSTTLLYDLLSQGVDVDAIMFEYGQKHRKEVEAAKVTCKKLGVPYKVVDVNVLGRLAPSSLTREDVAVPEGHYEDESMKQTVVPNRNMVLISLATSYAIGLGINKVYYAAHSGDHAIYPDCRPAFLIALGKALKLCDYTPICLEAPYMYWDKSDIVKRGLELEVDYSLTWSCYLGKEKPCGKCGTCTERAEAFSKAGAKDPLE